MRSRENYCTVQNCCLRFLCYEYSVIPTTRAYKTLYNSSAELDRSQPLLQYSYLFAVDIIWNSHKIFHLQTLRWKKEEKKKHSDIAPWKIWLANFDDLHISHTDECVRFICFFSPRSKINRWKHPRNVTINEIRFF